LVKLNFDTGNAYYNALHGRVETFIAM